RLPGRLVRRRGFVRTWYSQPFAEGRQARDVAAVGRGRGGARPLSALGRRQTPPPGGGGSIPAGPGGGNAGGGRGRPGRGRGGGGRGLVVPAAAVGPAGADRGVAHHPVQPRDRVARRRLLHEFEERLLHHVLGRGAPLPRVQHQRRGVGVHQPPEKFGSHHFN